jgi:hypothetical protein
LSPAAAAAAAAAAADQSFQGRRCLHVLRQVMLKGWVPSQHLMLLLCPDHLPAHKAGLTPCLLCC